MEPDSGFDALGLSPQLLDSLKAAGLREPFPVQTEAIPLVLARRDLLARAPTGSGKTIAFGAPILQNLLASSRRPSAGPGRPGTPSLRALVLVPTRELAAQVGEVTLRLARRLPVRIKVCVAAGGVSVNPQMMALRGGADFLVATPGRLLDLVGRHAVSLASLEVLVLDEADRLLDLGFRDELDRIRALLPATRQRERVRLRCLWVWAERSCCWWWLSSWLSSWWWVRASVPVWSGWWLPVPAWWLVLVGEPEPEPERALGAVLVAGQMPVWRSTGWGRYRSGCGRGLARQARPGGSLAR